MFDEYENLQVQQKTVKYANGGKKKHTSKSGKTWSEYPKASGSQ